MSMKKTLKKSNTLIRRVLKSVKSKDSGRIIIREESELFDTKTKMSITNKRKKVT